MIQFGETVLNEFFEKHLQQIIKNYLAFKTSVDEQFGQWLDLSANLADQTKKSLPPLSSLKSIFDFTKEPGDQRGTKMKKKEVMFPVKQYDKKLKE